MTVSREDVESYLTAISTWKSLCVKYPATVPMNVELNVTTSLYTLNGIEQVLEDRLNQVDYKSLAEYMYGVIKTLESCMESDDEINFKRKSGKGINAMWGDIEQAISKYEQAIKEGE